MWRFLHEVTSSIPLLFSAAPGFTQVQEKLPARASAPAGARGLSLSPLLKGAGPAGRPFSSPVVFPPLFHRVWAGE